MSAPDLAVLLVAPFVGSFMGVLIRRLPAGEPVLLGRSRCEHCGTALRWTDMIPLVTWLARRGRCRCGRVRLSAFYPAIELGALLVAAWAALVVDGWLLVGTCALGWTLLTLSWIDAEHRLLPDALTLPLIPAGLLVIGLIEPGKLLPHALGGLLGGLGFAALGVLYRKARGREGLGLGDAKLLAAGGAWVGAAGLPGVILIGAVSGLAFALLRRRDGEPLDAASELPFGPHLALGIWLVWLYGPLQFG